MEFDRDLLLAAFREETDEALATLEDSLLLLDEHPENGEALASVFRVAHTLKGNAFSLGMRALGDFAHALEELLERLRDGRLSVSAEIIARLLRAVDALRAIVPAAIAGADALTPEQESLRAELHSVVVAPSGRASQPGPAAPAQRRSMRVDLEKLDRILALIGTMAVARLRLGQVLEQDGALSDAVDLHRELDRMTRDLHEEVMRVRAVPAGGAFRPQARALYDATLACGKQARLVFEGEDVQADTAVIDGIRDPLAHMVRNAVAHGLETPAERSAAGKDPCGVVTLRARQESGGLVIEVSDDGRGFDRGRLVEAARARGIAAPESLRDEELHDLAFLPGFSTAEAITEVAGRGVGLDVVRSAVEALRGTLTLESRPGLGATFTLRLPLTLAIIDGFAVGIGDETFVVPIDAVVECLDLPPGGTDGGSSGYMNLRGQPLPYLRLRSMFQVGTPAPDRECLIVVQHAGRRAGLAVDALHGVCQVLVKPLAKTLRNNPGVSGSSILGTGRVALVLEVQSLLRDALRQFRPETPGAAA
jgi:two-component system chemotaxis sensor kinase CheA